jgi:hypothetical protein
MMPRDGRDTECAHPARDRRNGDEHKPGDGDQHAEPDNPNRVRRGWWRRGAGARREHAERG